MVLVLFVSLLLVVRGIAGSNLSDDVAVLGELENLEIEGDDVELFDYPSWTSERGSKVLVNVDGFGAVGDGVSDDTQVIIIFLLMSNSAQIKQNARNGFNFMPTNSI